ncbi:MAG: histidinol-phosphate transaminase [Acidimicrobiales bacterium]
MALRAGYHSPQVEVEVRLNTNESPEPPPTEFLEELAQAVLSLDPNRYPDREATELRSAIAKHHGVEPEQVFCANGSNEVLQCLMLAFGGPGRKALVFEPTYALHSHIARLTGTGVIAGERDDHFSVDPAHAARLLEEHQPDVVFLCSPNNPTGNSESRATVEAIARAAPGLVIVDEAYAQFAPWSATELLESSGNLAVTRTFSKTWALAALRLGYVLADPAVVDACSSVVLPYHLDALKQQAGITALRYGQAMRERVARTGEERGRVENGLSLLPVDVWPSDANFVLFRPRRRDAQTVWQELVQRSVLVRDVSGFPKLEGCLRVTIGTSEENTRFLQELAEVLGH